MERKKCSTCLRYLPIDSFQLDSQKSDGLRSYCKPCRSKKSRSYIAIWKRRRDGAEYPKNKTCSKCKNIKLIENFVRDSCRPDGFHVWCRDCRIHISKNSYKRYKEKFPDKLKKHGRKQVLRQYGITESIYESFLQNQSGGCAICKTKPQEGKNLHIDHCHKSNKIRGLLCGNCNRAIGQLQDSPEICRNAADYLEH